MRTLTDFFQKNESYRVVLLLTPAALNLLSLKGKSIDRFEKIWLRETSEETLRVRTFAFCKDKKTKPLLILPRSEVLQKELSLAESKNSPGFASEDEMQQWLEAQLKQLLPLPSTEMAYGLRIDGSDFQNKGLLYALPEKKVIQTLEFLHRIGLEAEEVLTEDQVCAWFFLERKETGTCLFFDQNEERLLCLLMENGTLKFSRSFSISSFGQDVLDEISFLLLESNQQPKKIVLSGLETESESLIRNHFLLPLEQLASPTGKNMPFSLNAAQYYPKYDFISLLPKSQKIQRLLKSYAALFRQVALALAFLIVTFGVFFMVRQSFVHFQVQNQKKLQTQYFSEAEEIQKILHSLEVFSRAQSSKVEILELLKVLSEKLPSAIRFQELQFSGADFSFKAESSSPQSISEAVQVFEKIESIKKVSLQHTRLRKRLNEDVFEFEIAGEAKWSVANEKNFTKQ
jgi:hypothetical protein